MTSFRKRYDFCRSARTFGWLRITVIYIITANRLTTYFKLSRLKVQNILLIRPIAPEPRAARAPELPRNSRALRINPSCNGDAYGGRSSNPSLHGTSRIPFHPCWQLAEYNKISRKVQIYLSTSLPCLLLVPSAPSSHVIIIIEPKHLTVHPLGLLLVNCCYPTLGSRLLSKWQTICLR